MPRSGLAYSVRPNRAWPMNEMLRYSRTPDTLRAPGARLRPADHLYRAAYAALIGHVERQSADRVARERFADDQVTPLVLKSHQPDGQSFHLIERSRLCRRSESATENIGTVPAAHGCGALEAFWRTT